MYFWALASLKLEIETHRFERQQKIRKNNGGIDAQFLCRSDRHLGGQLRPFTNLNQRMRSANGLVFRHIATCLPQKPYRGSVDRLPQTGADKTAAARCWTIYGLLFF